VIHELKTWPDPFGAVRRGEKMHEIRKDDRPFDVDDVLHLREWDPKTKSYTGREVKAIVTYITRGGEWGVPEGLCVMSIDVTWGTP
jgi:hypothetical protein